MMDQGYGSEPRDERCIACSATTPQPRAVAPQLGAATFELEHRA